MDTSIQLARAVAPIVPIARCAVTVRDAVAADVLFIDKLQRMHTHMVGWMPTKQLEAYVAKGHVLIAEDETHSALGYCMGRDKYKGRDDVGIIYQLNVLPGMQRNLVGATLIRAMFDRAAYGCKLFCCWCAQDIQANHFWESIGFVPLAFRAGSRAKQRVHIFWQRRIRADDTTTPYWFPSETNNGAMREDRLVLPIPPGTVWQDAKPMVLPGMGEQRQLEGPEQIKTRRSRNGTLKPLSIAPPVAKMLGGWSFTPPRPAKPAAAERKPRPKMKNDPKLVAAARELRDRWMEQVNADERLLPQGKYDVSRQIESATVEVMSQAPLMIEQKAAA